MEATVTATSKPAGSSESASSSRSALPRLMEPVNDLLKPGIKLGIANPLPFTSGLVILDVIGRKSGILRSVPVLAADYGRGLLISTVRADSQWAQNLAAAGLASVWLRGRQRPVHAAVFRAGTPLGAAHADSLLENAAQVLSQVSGATVAALIFDD
jgi:hypothetical protein